ncbi:MAG: ABC transporter ATP-binding/permease protein [Nitrosomonadaceae bacterium]|nr:ABC transporter ATP-binding/permease protein [Nitrosomonadaceae bacterium]
MSDVSFTAIPGTLTAIIGPNGAGKTTLMRVLSGERPYSGIVSLNDHNMYTSPEYWLQYVGYVPVDNVLHEQLTAWQALMFIARLRLPEVPVDEIKVKIDTLLSEFDFLPNDARRTTRLHKLSSGERKRVNICAELITDPPLLLLDEPTSNLDPDAERILMQKLKERAHRAKQTILVITHTLNTIGECDRIIFIENAHLRVVASPENALAQLEAEIPQPELEASDFYRWAAVFEHFKLNEESRRRQHTRSSTEIAAASQDMIEPRRIPTWYQLRLLVQRYFRLRLADWRVLLLTLSLGLIGGVFLFILPERALVRPDDPGDFPAKIVAARQSVFLIAIVVTLIGMTASFREISRDFHIYRHERRKGLSPLAVVLSKWIWLSVFVGIVAPCSLLLMLAIQQPLPSSPLPLNVVVGITGFTLVLACVAALSLGIMLSSLAGEDNLATTLLSIVVVFQVMLSGLLKNQLLEDLINNVSILATTRWAFEGLSSNLGYYCWSSVKGFDEFDSSGHIVSVWLSLVAYIIVTLTVSVVALRYRDAWSVPVHDVWSAFHRFKIGLGSVITVVILLSWITFLRGESWEYFKLAFNDQEFGGIRFARIENVKMPSQSQLMIGYISQSRCGEIEE